MKRWLFLCFSLLIFVETNAQTAAQNATYVNAALAELKKRGLSEDEVRQRLKERGIDIDNVKPEELPRLQKQIEEVLSEIEREKQLKADRLAAQQDTTDVPTDEEDAPKVVKKPRKKVEQVLEETDENATDEADGTPVKKKKSAINSKTDPSVSEPKKGQKTAQKPIKKKNSLEDAINGSNKNGDDSLSKAKIYGQDVFRNGKLDIRKSKDFKASDTYVLGDGDRITVSISGAAFYNSTLTVNADGAISPSQMPKIFVRGLSLGKAKRVIETSFSRFYSFRREDFDVSVNAIRTITVNIVGEVFEAGSYQMSGGNTAFNALVAAGGPTDIGSPRNIQVIRSNGEKRRLDVYEFLLDPSVAKDFFLFDNDYISVPVAERVVEIQGAIRRPYKYELIRGEGLTKLLSYAGGFSEKAVQTTVQVKRFVNDREQILDINWADLTKRGGDFDLINGDVVVVKAIGQAFENFANVLGAVEQSGNYEITEGMRIADLLAKAKLRREARTDVAYLQRTNADQTIALKFLNLDDILKNKNSESNILLQSKDRLLVYRQEIFSQKDSVTIAGAVRNELRFPFDPAKSIRVSDIVTLAGGLRPDATDFAYIVRRNPKNVKLVEYKRVEIKSALDRPNSVDNLVLQANDSLFVQSRVTFANESNVTVSGAVRQTGDFQWNPSLTLLDALTLAGGLRLEAAANRVDIFRVQFNGNQEVRTIVATVEVDRDLNFGDPTAASFGLQPYDQIVVRSIPEFSLLKMVNIAGEVKFNGSYALIDKNERLLSLIQRAGGLSAEAFPPGATVYRQQDNIGYVVIRLEEVLKNPSSNYNIILKEGDLIDIPKTKDIVTIRGATQYNDLYPDKITAAGKVNVAFDGERSVLYYVNTYAAGVGKDGRKRLISVEHPNGQVERTKDYFFFKIYPKVQKGSIVTVGYVEKKKDNDGKKSERKDVDWGKVLADSVAQATALLSFILLIQRIN